MEFITSRKGSDMISHEGFLYRMDKTKINSIHWRCTKTGCKGRLTTSLQYREQQQPPMISGAHMHPPNPAEVAARRVENAIKTAAVTTQDPPQRIVQDAMALVNEEVATAVGSRKKLCQTISRKRKAIGNKPPTSANIEELFLPDMLRQTTDERDLLLYDSGLGDVHRMLIFSTDQFLQTLHDSEHWMCDGTFNVSPSLFYQVYTVNALIREKWHPCILVLLPNKQQVTYSKMWTEIKSLKPGLSPVSVQIDFELASKAALIEAFPKTHIYGCYFQLGQSLLRQIQENGLKQLYEQDSNTRMALKRLLALAFVPVDEVSDAFDESVAVYSAEVMPLVNYFEDNYVGRRNKWGDRRQPLFPIHMWSVKARQDAGLPQTNNQLESWHTDFQGSTRTHHPNTFRFIEAIRREEALQEAKVEFITSRKGSDMISHEGFLYRMDKTKLNSIHWRCTKTGCKGRLTTSLHYREQQYPPVISGVHTHPPNPTEVAARRVENAIKTAAVTTQDPPQSIVQNVMAEVNEEVAIAVASPTRLCQTICRKRKAIGTKPPTSANIEELFIPDMLRQTTDERDFLLYDSGRGDVQRMLIFSTDQFLQTLHDSEHWMCDGTFKVSPSLFYQLYTVHALIRNYWLPCIFVLLPNKQQVTYLQMWTEIKSLKPGLSPVSVQIDFELASKAALIEAFPKTHIYGCYFHLGQSLWRKIQENGLQQLYEQDSDTLMALKMLLALAFLPVDEVSDAFDELVAVYPAEVMPLVNYFEDNYVGRRNKSGDRRQPLFPIHMWSVKARQDAGLPRTNHQLESWHRDFQASTQTHPTNVWLIEAIRREEALQREKRAQLVQGRDLTQQMKKHVTINTRIAAVQQNRDQYDLREFLQELAHNLEIDLIT